MSCPECGAPQEHLPEECPAAEWEAAGPTLGACEAWFVRFGEGRHLAAQLGWGTQDYYQAVIEGVTLMHNVGGCPVGQLDN